MVVADLHFHESVFLHYLHMGCLHMLLILVMDVSLSLAVDGRNPHGFRIKIQEIILVYQIYLDHSSL